MRRFREILFGKENRRCWLSSLESPRIGRLITHFVASDEQPDPLRSDQKTKNYVKKHIWRSSKGSVQAQENWFLESATNFTLTLFWPNLKGRN